MNHLAVYNKKIYGDDYIELMLNGTKTIDSKFTYRRTAPYNILKKGDYIYLKESSGPIRGRVQVKSVISKELSGPDEVMEFLAPNYTLLGIKNEKHLLEVWERQKSKVYVCQWHMVQPKYANYPIVIYKRGMQSWISNYNVPENVLVRFV